MKLKILLSAIPLIWALLISGLLWAQCPEDSSDLGHCDTLSVVPWPETDTCFIQCYMGSCDTICINDPGEQFPSFLYVHLFVTHDSNTFWWQGGSKWVQDSIRGITVPLVWETEGCADSIVFPTYDNWNNKRLQEGHAQMPRSVFRHFVDYQTGDTTKNRLFEMVENEKEPWNTYINFNADTVAISVIPFDPGCQSWWEGPYDPGTDSYGRVLFATLTFQVYLGDNCDTAKICIDSAFWPPNSNFSFIRYDATGFYLPRHNLPFCTWAGPPMIQVISPNGGESWLVGETYDINWIWGNFTGANVKLEYSTDAGANWMTIIDSTPNDGVHPWVIPDTPSDSCRVKISDAEDGDPYDVSDSDFSITHEPDFTIDALPDTQWVKQGDTTGFEVILTSLNGFDSPCTLTVDGLPTLATGEFDPSVIIPTDTSILTIGIDSLTPLGAYPLTITATEMTKQVEHSTQKWLIVVSALNFKPTLSVPELVVVYEGFTANFNVVATDPDTSDTLTITKEGIGEFPCPPRTTPNVCYFWWTTEEGDTLNSPYEVTFVVDDGRDSTDTGIVWIDVLPYHIPPSGMPGDANGDSIVDIADAIFLLQYLFGGGPPPNPPSAGDANGDCFIGISDVIWIINYLFLGGPPPQIRCLPGDVNFDGNVNLSDVFYLIDYIFFNGPSPVSMRSTDVNADCFINVVDLVCLINYLLRGGLPPLPGCVEPKPGLEMAPPPAIAEVGFSDLRYDQKSRIMELPVYANFEVPVAGVALSITWNPEELLFLNPILTPRSEGLGLYHNLKPGELTIGMVDISGANTLKPGTDPIVILRFVPEDRKRVNIESIQIERATFVNTKGQELLLRMAK